MPEQESDLLLEQIADTEDIHFLRAVAAGRGISVEQLVKEEIEGLIVTRTRPETMTGTVQPFRRPYIPSRHRPE